MTTLVKQAAKTASTRLAFADGLRGLAALWVVFFHLSAGGHIDSLKARLPAWLNLALFEAGDLGVAVFFALSGFVMALTVPAGLNGWGEVYRFMARRVVRLTPPYYLAIAFALAMIGIKLKVTGQDVSWLNGWVILANMSYLQGLLSMKNIDSVFWTLCIEIQFYLAFAVLLWGIAKLARGGILSFQGRILLHFSAWASLFWFFVSGSYLWNVPGSFLSFWYSFMAGLMACHGWKQTGWVRGSAVAFLLSVLVLAWVQHSAFMFTVALTAGALLVVGVWGRMSRILSWAPLQSLALSSYSLYLLHNPITGAVANLLRRILGVGAWPDLVVAICSLGACLVAARLAYWLVEVPSMRWSRRWS